MRMIYKLVIITTWDLCDKSAEFSNMIHNQNILKFFEVEQTRYLWNQNHYIYLFV